MTAMAADGAVAGDIGFMVELGLALLAALLGGALAVRLGQPAVLGYLLAGVAIGPFTPGYVGDREQIGLLAEIGVVLLLFALGVEFSLRDLLAVRRVAIGAGILQIVVITVATAVATSLLGVDPRSALVLGAAVAISSTLVVVRLLIDRGEMDSLHGRALVGWMVVQDLATIVMVVSLPALDGSDVLAPLLLAAARGLAFLGLAFVVGARLLPRLFAGVARLGSQELFLLAVMSTALVAAILSAAVFGLGPALGAFVAGLVVSGSSLGYRAAAEVIPFRDLFAVLFFVSVGMLVDPASLVEQSALVALLVVVAVAGKGIVSAGLARIVGLPWRSAILLAAILGQVGEFSFILAQQAREAGLLSQPHYDALLGTALLSIVVTPFAVAAAERIVMRLERRTSAGGPPLAAAPDPGEDTRARVVVLGAGRVGLLVAQAVRARGFHCTVVEHDRRRLGTAAQMGAETIFGDAANPRILARSGLERARVLVVAIPDPLAARLATERALAVNPRLAVAARASGASARRALEAAGVRRVADPDVEAGIELARHALQRMGVSGAEVTAVAIGLRRAAYGPSSGPTLG